MCGIFGIVAKANAQYSAAFLKKALNEVASVSIARGQDSSGMVFKSSSLNEYNLIKGDIPITKLLRLKVYYKQLNQALELYKQGLGFQVMGHARLVTNGSQLKEVNNQPVLKDKIIGIHNGIVINNEALWKNNPELKRDFDIDTEVILSLLSKHLVDTSLSASVKQVLGEIEGTASCALMFQERNELVLFTNNGSLYYILENGLLIFASERYFLDYVLKKLNLKAVVRHLGSLEGIVVDTNTLIGYGLNDDKGSIIGADQFCAVNITNIKGDFDQEVVIDPMEFIDRNKELVLFDLLENNSNAIGALKRCSACILPETFPFIHFDENGVCNYCKNHKPQQLAHNFDKLKELVAAYKRKNGQPDCIVPFSGGRDSTYSLHIAKKELGLNPIAFTYDWGMVTDLARRNIARVCGKLGVENIIVSADIKWKRENIRKNITAWLKKPDLGMIPLFMAGDKYFFYYCNQVKKQTGIDLNIWGINNLENTNFKTGFAGLSPQFDKKTIYSLSVFKQLKLFGFVGKNLIQSPGYLNQSVFDSLGSFAARYIAPKKDYFHLFDYYSWNEKEIESLIEKEYHWEKSIDTNSTWRIGDGTASFYNYIYYTVAGFTENDTFRSNQIREGMITRDEALKKINEENLVRYETLRWYLEIINIDFKHAVSVINKIPKLYRVN